MTYLCDLTVSPPHMKRMMAMKATKKFEFIDGETMDGLVDEEHDEATDRSEEIMEYVMAQLTPENRFEPGPGIRIDYYISIAAS